ncbi:ankyrin repeat domain-containing protein [Alteromonas gilva]|uniref:Ankyrin repeat domain-containing protein n=1 Tax=Alteromonas gilva TaxID=2987522 RepID=A0ABT5L519_9ALTE|nr:ankyrin repeat domain-containing protein [Alteromonas gilva]MDC8831486.1 ankyrin repeat domain-containing protein [Alteromonas gilva]
MSRTIQRVFKAANNKRYLASAILTVMVLNGVACTSESPPVSVAPELTSLRHDELVLQTKHAMLNLDVALVDKLSSMIDVNRPLPDRSTLLAWAIETQTPDLVNLLLNKGAAVHIANSNRFSPMIQACRYGNPAIINALLDRGGDPNRAIEDGTSALHLCAGSAPVDILARMVRDGANINNANSAGQTPLMWAANAGRVDNLHYLVDAGADINQQTNQGYSPLFFAIKSQQLDVVKAAISRGADVLATAKDGTTATQLAVYTHNYDFLTWYARELKSLLAPDAIATILSDFDREGYQLLHAAVRANQAELVSALLALGADPRQVSEASTLTWRYEANFKTQSYVPPRLTPIEIAEQNDLPTIVSLLREQAKS